MGDLRGPNYRETDTCATCRHVFVRVEYDDDAEYFCRMDGSERPWCASSAMNESFIDHPRYQDERPFKFSVLSRWIRRRWERWSEGRRVSARGRCDAWEPKEERR